MGKAHKRTLSSRKRAKDMSSATLDRALSTDKLYADPPKPGSEEKLPRKMRVMMQAMQRIEDNAAGRKPKPSHLHREDVPREWRYLSGNWGTVSSLDESGRRLYFEAGCCYSNKGTFLGVVDVDTAELQASPRFKGDMPLSSTGLTMMSHL